MRSRRHTSEWWSAFFHSLRCPHMLHASIYPIVLYVTSSVRAFASYSHSNPLSIVLIIRTMFDDELISSHPPRYVQWSSSPAVRMSNVECSCVCAILSSNMYPKLAYSCIVLGQLVCISSFVRHIRVHAFGSDVASWFCATYIETRSRCANK